MKREDNKSNCPVNLTAEIFGDTWSLLIIRDMLSYGKNTFGDFLDSEERIGPSVLAERLVHLEEKGIISKRPCGNDRRKNIYTLTGKGLTVIPIVYEAYLWATRNRINPDPNNIWLKVSTYDREYVIRLWREALESGSSFFSGPDSVVRKLNMEGWE